MEPDDIRITHQALEGILDELNARKERAGRSELGRRLALASTKLEECLLWLYSAAEEGN